MPTHPPLTLAMDHGDAIVQVTRRGDDPVVNVSFRTVLGKRTDYISLDPSEAGKLASALGRASLIARREDAP